MSEQRPHRVGLVTDSSSQIPEELVERYAIEVVPITVVMDGIEHQEGVTLGPDTFWSAFADRTPEVSTSQPSPGAFAQAYARLVEQGCTDIVSVHIAEAFSGTLNAARLGAEAAAVPVELIDTGTMSFGVACCLWEAAEAVKADASAAEAAAAARQVAQHVRTAFIVQAAEFARAGGRIADRLPEDSDGIPVMVAGPGDRFETAGAAHDVDTLCDLMAAAMHSDGAPIRVGISLADASTAVFADGLEARLRDRSDVADLVRYRVGPSVGAHSGPGTAGGFWYPLT